MSLHLCEHCLAHKPAEQFGDPTHGVICKACMSTRDLSRSEALLKDKAKAIAGELVAVSTDDLQETTKLRGILQDIYQNFGGTTGFASHLHWVIIELSSRKPVPASVGNLMVALLKLHHSVEQTEESVTAREMTDDQLKRETELATIRLIVESASDPSKREMLDTILGKHGLTIKEASSEELISEVTQKLETENA